MTRGTIILISAMAAFVFAVLAVCFTVLLLRFGHGGFGGAPVEPVAPGVEGEMFSMNGNVATPQAGRPVYLMPVGFAKVFATEREKAAGFRAAIPALEAEVKRLTTDLEQAEDFETSLKQKETLARRWENEARRVEKVLGDFRVVGYNSFTFLNPLSGKQVRVAFEDAGPGVSLGRWKEDTAAKLNEVVEQCRSRAEASANAIRQMEHMRRPEALVELQERLTELNREIATTKGGALTDDQLMAALVSRVTPIAVSVSDMEGAYVLEAPPGEYELAAWNTGGDVWLEPVTIPESGRRVANLSNANVLR